MKWRSMLVLLLAYRAYVDGEQLWEVGKVPSSILRLEHMRYKPVQKHRQFSAKVSHGGIKVKVGQEHCFK